MKFKKKLLIVMSLLLMLIVIGAVSAANYDDNVNLTKEDTSHIDDVLAVEESSAGDNSGLELEKKSLRSSKGEILGASIDVAGNTFADVQKAINSSSDGDTLYLDGKYFTGNGTEIIIDKQITIIGKSTDGESMATLDADGLSRILTVKADNVTLKEICFKNGKSQSNGGAVYWYGDNCVLQNSSFYENVAIENGGAVYWYGDNGAIYNCEVRGNHAGGKGGAVYWYGDKGSYISSYTYSNYALGDGGVIFWTGDQAKLLGGEFQDNYAGGNGGVVYFDSTKAEVTGVTFRGNYVSAKNGGAIYNGQHSELSVDTSAFVENSGKLGNSIYNEGILSLTGVVANTTAADIYSVNGAQIKSAVYAEVLNKTGKGKYAEKFTVVAVLKDAKGNLIADENLFFVINNEYVEPYIEGKYYIATYTPYVLGTIPVNLTYNSPENFNVTTGSVEVSKVKAILNITAYDLYEGNPLTINVNLTDEYLNNLSGTVALTVGGEVYTVDVSNGTGSITINNLSAGDYPLMAMFEDPFYDANFVSGTIYVRGSTVLNVTVQDEYVYGDEITVRFALTTTGGSNVTDYINVTLNNEEYSVLIYEGAGYLTVNSLFVGNYTVTANYDGNRIYESKTSSAEFNVTPKIIDSADVYGNIECYTNTRIYIVLHSSVDGNYTLNVNGTVSVAEVISGTGGADSYVQGAGYYTLNIIINDGNYSLNKTVGFTFKENPVFSENIYGTYPEGFIEITGPDGNYHFKLGKKTVDVTVSGGKGNATFENVAAGIYEGKIKFDGNDRYASREIETIFMINKKEINITIDPISNVKYGESAVINYNISYETGLENITIFDLNGKVYEYELNNHVITVSNLSAGSYIVNIYSPGNANYTRSHANAMFIVDKIDSADIELSVSVGQENRIPYGENVTFYVGLSNSTGVMNGTVTISVNNKKYNVTVLDGEGNVTVSGLDPEEYTAVAAYPSDNYNDVISSCTFTVLSPDVTLGIVAEEIRGGETAVVNITLTDKDGDAYYGVVLLEINDKEYAVYVNATGKASLEIYGLAVNLTGYLINATFMQDRYHNSVVNDTEFIIVNKYDTEKLITITTCGEVTYGENATVTVELPLNATGSVAVVIEGINGIFVDEVSGGIAIVEIPGLSGNKTYTVQSVSYSGDDDYSPCTISDGRLVFDVVQAPSYVYLSPIGGKFDYPGNVSFYFIAYNKTNVTVVVYSTKDWSVVKMVNFTGEFEEIFTAKVNVADLLPATYYIEVINYGNENYSYATAETPFRIVKADPAFSSNATENNTVCENVTVIVSAPVDATGNVSIVVDGEAFLTGEALDNGTVVFVLEGLEAGRHSYVVSYEGDKNYNAATDFKYFDVNKKDTSNVTMVIPTYSEIASPTYSISLPSDATGFFEVDVDGKKYTAAVVNGSASITVPNLSEGAHKVTVSYSGDANYSAISKSSNLTIHIPVYKILKNKDVSVIYMGKMTYKVYVTKDGKSVGANQIVDITFNGQKHSVKTDSNGYATITLATDNLNVKTYVIEASYMGVSVQNNVKVKHIIKAKNKRVKLSKYTKVRIKSTSEVIISTGKKVTKIKIKLKKVDGKYLKGKKLKVKFKGKTYKVKTNKKGAATWKIKKNMAKKLKVGKKYKYTVTFGKDKVTKKIKFVKK